LPALRIITAPPARALAYIMEKIIFNFVILIYGGFQYEIRCRFYRLRGYPVHRKARPGRKAGSGLAGRLDYGGITDDKRPLYGLWGRVVLARGME
jgi:hypothetical protein